jgi:chromate transporter
VKLILLYFLLLKASVTTFNGPSSLPVLRDDFVVKRQILTDRQLNAAVTAARSAPGPMGIYIVSVGYFAAGVPGAMLGWLAMVTPAFLVIPVLRYAGHRVDHPRVRSTLEAAMLATAGLILASVEPLARDSITGWLPFSLALATFFILVATKIETIWVIAAAALIGVLRVALA